MSTVSKTRSEWNRSNSILDQMQVGVETDTGRKKLGDGVSPWSSLDYLNDKTLRMVNSEETTLYEGVLSSEDRETINFSLTKVGDGLDLFEETLIDDVVAYRCLRSGFYRYSWLGLQFAISVEDLDGPSLSFGLYGMRQFSPPTWAMVTDSSVHFQIPPISEGNASGSSSENGEGGVDILVTVIKLDTHEYVQTIVAETLSVVPLFFDKEIVFIEKGTCLQFDLAEIPYTGSIESTAFNLPFYLYPYLIS